MLVISLSPRSAVKGITGLVGASLRPRIDPPRSIPMACVWFLLFLPSLRVPRKHGQSLAGRPSPAPPLSLLPSLLPTVLASRIVPPAGAQRASPAAFARRGADKFKFPPFQYESHFGLLFQGGSSSWRVPLVLERQLLLNLRAFHTECCWASSQASVDPSGFELEQPHLLGNSFHCGVVAWLVGHLSFFFLPPRRPSCSTSCFHHFPGSPS